jgi:hypothetical protein
MSAPGAEHRLLSHHAIAHHFRLLPVGILDQPAPAHQLNRIVADVFNADEVGEDVLIAGRIGLVRQESRRTVILIWSVSR